MAEMDDLAAMLGVLPSSDDIEEKQDTSGSEEVEDAPGVIGSDSDGFDIYTENEVSSVDSLDEVDSESDDSDDDWVEFDDADDDTAEGESETEESVDDIDWDDDDDDESVSESDDDLDTEEEEENIDWDEEDSSPVTTPSDLGVKEGGIPSELEVEINNASHALQSEFGIDADSYVLKHRSISIDEIVTQDPLRKSRNRSAKGLTQSVKELGIVSPIHVLVTESYAEWLDSDTDEIFTGSKYLLLDGFRRMYGAVKNGIDKVEAIVWEFNDAQYGNSVSIILSLMINKRQKRQWEETWGLYKVLEMRSAMSPSTLEYLLELESGDAMKLKDVAMATAYPEVWESLITAEKSLDQAYKQLQKLRKDEDKASMEDAKGISEFEESDGIVGDHSDGRLTDAEARELLEINQGKDALEFSDDDSDMVGLDEGDLQSTSERKPLDPVLRQAILRRDDFTCQVCGLGAGIQSGIALGTFEIHHTASVMAGLDASRDDTGNISDEIDIPKLITLCSTDHKLVHLIVRHDGKLGISREEFDELSENEQDRWRKAGKLAKVLLWAEKKSGKKAQRADSIKLPQNKPFWEIEKENMDALKIGNQVEKYGRDYSGDSED